MICFQCFKVSFLLLVVTLRGEYNEITFSFFFLPAASLTVLTVTPSD